MNFNEDATGMLWSSQVAIGQENGLVLRIFGDKGSLIWREEIPNFLSFASLDQSTQILTRGGAGMKEIVKRVMDGDKLTPVNVLYPPAQIATAMDITVMHYKSNAPARGCYILGSPLIHKDNAEQFHFPDSPF